MELIYSMRRKPLKCEPPHFETSSDPEVVRPICTISACNIIAFSSPTELSDSDGATWGGHVYVCDLDTPWDSYKVTSTVHPVSALEWDSEGKQLLVGTTVGDVSVYGMKEYLLNDWTVLYSASFPGEHIIKAAFFHNGRRVAVAEKKPDAPITERLQLLRPTPTLKGFGGVACEGACVITGTGLVGALTPGAERALSAAECLRGARDQLPAAAIAHKNGGLVVAAAGRRCVRCAVCAVSLCRAAQHRPTLRVQPLPTVYLEHTPVSITWCLREDTDSLLIAGNTLSMWKLTERSHPVHKLLSKGPLQGSTTPGGGQKPGSDCFNTVVWQQVSAAPIDGCAAHVCARRLPVAPPLHALAAAAPSRLLLARDAHYICSTPVVVSGAPGGEPAAGGTPPKKPKYGGALPTGAPCAIVSCVDLSWLGGVVVAIDTHAQLHVYATQPDIPSPLSVQHATSLLEYSMVSGIDCRDVIMTLKQNTVEAVYERLTESFQRQPPSFQQYYYQSWLKLRIALCRVVPSAQGVVSALTCLFTLQCAAAMCAGGVRDRDDERRLEALLDGDDKALLALESKPELSGEAGALLPLRRVLQLCTDIAVTHLHHAAHPAQPHEPWTDSATLALLRRLMVAARAAGRGAEQLSRALARLQQAPSSKEVREECAALCTVLQSPRVWESLPRCCVSAPHGQPRPHYFEYGVEPEALRYAPEPPNYGQCDVVPSQEMDCIRYMYLGGGRRAARWRQCGRCGARALPAPRPGRHPLQRAADGRFLPACRSVSVSLTPACGARALPAPRPGRHPLQRAADGRFLPACRSVSVSLTPACGARALPAPRPGRHPLQRAADGRFLPACRSVSVSLTPACGARALPAPRPGRHPLQRAADGRFLPACRSVSVSLTPACGARALPAPRPGRHPLQRAADGRFLPACRSVSVSLTPACGARALPAPRPGRHPLQRAADGRFLPACRSVSVSLTPACGARALPAPRPGRHPLQRAADGRFLPACRSVSVSLTPACGARALPAPRPGRHPLQRAADGRFLPACRSVSVSLTPACGARALPAPRPGRHPLQRAADGRFLPACRSVSVSLTPACGARALPAPRPGRHPLQRAADGRFLPACRSVSVSLTPACGARALPAPRPGRHPLQRAADGRFLPACRSVSVSLTPACGARALPAPRPGRHPLQRAADGRFLPACRCGGKWTLVSNY